MAGALGIGFLRSLTFQLLRAVAPDTPFAVALPLALAPVLAQRPALVQRFCWWVLAVGNVLLVTVAYPCRE